MKLWLLLIVGALIPVLPTTAGSRILFISALCSKSQKGFFTSLVHALGDNGHTVTIVSPYKPSKSHPNVKEIFLEDLAITKFLPNLFTSSGISGPQNLIKAAPKICSDALASNEVQNLLKEEFDVAMYMSIMNDCFHSIFHQLKIPVIGVCPLDLVAPASVVAGNPLYSSFINSPFVHSSHPFTFPERLLNTVVDFASASAVVSYILPSIEAECRRRGLCAETLPSLLEMSQNTSLMFVNSVKSAETPPRPYLPNIIHVGGIHCKEAKPLPQDLEKWVNESGDDGFIFFSLGSVVVPSTMPEKYRKILIDTFASMKQRVLWRWDLETMDDLPPNVRLGKWLPQQDILGHPRLKLFITHGGALSTQESMYHATPVLGLPVFADQMANMMTAQRNGWAKVLKWEELNPQILRETILSIMTSEKMRAEVKWRSSLMHDLPTSPAQDVNYWTEYVIRHKGAPHMKSPFFSLPWYKIYNLDVWLSLIVATIVLLYVLLKLLLFIIRFCCCSAPKAKRD